MSFYLKQRPIAINIIVMMLCWMASSFCFYMINFQLQYLPGNIYANSYSSASADIIATTTSGFIFKWIGVKKSLIYAFSVATVGLALICFWGYAATNDHGQTWTLPILVLVSKIGISSAFNAVYLGNSVLFPTLFTATSMGICNIFARTASIFAPLVSTIPGVFPMYIALFLSAVTLVSVFFLQRPIDM
jgi:hypothetical protein